MNMNALPLIDFILRAESPALARHLSGIFAAIYRRGMAAEPRHVVNRDYGSGLVERRIAVRTMVFWYLKAVENSNVNNYAGGSPAAENRPSLTEKPMFGCVTLRWPPMSNSFPLSMLIVLALAECGLSGCGAINANLAAAVSDYVPHWAGGLPADAPPRPGTAKYDEYMRERQQKRLEAPPPNEETDKTSSASSSAVR